MIVLASFHRRAAHGLHRCCWCGSNINPRERYLDLRIATDGTVYTQRQHLACIDKVNRYGAYHGVEQDEPIDFDEVRQWCADPPADADPIHRQEAQ